MEYLKKDTNNIQTMEQAQRVQYQQNNEVNGDKNVIWAFTYIIKVTPENFTVRSIGLKHSS